MSLIAAKLPAFAHLAHVAATVATVWLASAIGPARATPEIGEEAPALVVNALDGTTFDLAKLRGKVVLVNYWATWCAPCRKEMPKLDAFYRRYHARGLEIIGISIDFERDFERLAKRPKPSPIRRPWPKPSPKTVSARRKAYRSPGSSMSTVKCVTGSSMYVTNC
jgi:thiol-disulfide isomerase/thioredoxin